VTDAPSYLTSGLKRGGERSDKGEKEEETWEVYGRIPGWEDKEGEEEGKKVLLGESGVQLYTNAHLGGKS